MAGATNSQLVVVFCFGLSAEGWGEEDEDEEGEEEESKECDRLCPIVAVSGPPFW